jgi:hypothetical protein
MLLPSASQASMRPARRRAGPKFDGTYILEFKTAEGEALAISIC